MLTRVEDEAGAMIRREIDRLLPADWVWEGKRALDFGSGAGRTLRHFADLVPHNRFWGCDVHGESIDRLNEHLAPMRGLRCGRGPGLPLDDGSLDLVWATSVFTHLTDHWSAWLHELHRLLAPGGLLVAACLGEDMRQAIADAPWGTARAGVTVTAHDESYDAGGPKVLASPWWTCARWQRAFEVLRVEPSGFTGGHGVVVARRRPAIAGLGREIAPMRAEP
jgi:SAM-dependent methyltransferase